MTISTANNSSLYPSPTASPQASFRTNLQQLTQALQSGNLTAAQQAYATLTQNAPPSNGQNNPLAQTLNQIGTALQSGDLSTAQQAGSSLAQQVQQGGHAHGHHHHHHSDASDQSSTTTTDPTSSTDPAASSITPQFVQLVQSVQSGNLTAAQQAYASLNQLQTSQSGTGSTPPQQISQLLNQLGTSLQTGDLSGAQQALTSFAQQWQAGSVLSATA